MQIFPGYWCDVFPHPEGIGMLVYAPQGRAVVLYVNGQSRSATTVPDSLLYLRACSTPTGEVWFIAQPGTAANRTLIGQVGFGSQLIQVNCYSRPAITWNGGAVVFYTQTSARTYREFLSADGPDAPDLPIPAPWSGTSQGISQVSSNGDIVWADSVYHVTIDGLSIHMAVTANGVTAGQGDVSGMVGVGPSGHFQALETVAPMEPRIAYSPVRNVWAVCSWTPAPTAVYQEMPPFTPIVVDPPPVDPDDPPIDPPDPVDPVDPDPVDPDPPVDPADGDVVKIGQKGFFRKWGTATDSAHSTAATAQGHQDAGFMSVQLGDGSFVTFDPASGLVIGSAPVAGAWERVTFNGGNVLVAQPNGGQGGVALPYEWFSL